MTNRSNVLAKQPRRQMVVVVWQSLVLDAYRSFFFELSLLLKNSNSNVCLISPEWFLEAGNQKIFCEPLPVRCQNQDHFRLIKLPISMMHVQAVWYWGLGRVFKNLKREADKNNTEIVVLCMSEPYAITTLIVWLTAWYRFARLKWSFAPYALQNIFKNFSPVIALIEKFILRNSKFILSLGTEQNKVLKEKKNQKPIVYFPLWYDRKIFGPGRFEKKPRHQSKNDVLSIGFVGKLCPEKGVPDLCEAIGLLDDHLKQTLQFIFVGKVFWDEWDAQSKALREKGWNISYKGALRPTEVANVYRELDLLIVPSRTEPHWKEQFGRIIVEAYACGLNVIGSDSGAIPEVLYSSDFVFPERSPKNLAAKIHSFVSGQLRVSADELIRFAEANYSDVALAQKFASILQGREDS